MPVITVSRQFGAGGEALARHLSEELGFLLVDRKAIIRALKEMGLPPQLVKFDELALDDEDGEKKRRFYLTALHDYLIGLAQNTSFVLIGRGGQFLFRNRPDAFHILVYAPFPQRVEWIREIHSLERKPASLLVRDQDRRKKRYLRQVFDRSWLDLESYDLVLNTASLTPEGANSLAVAASSHFLQRVNLLGVPEQVPGRMPAPAGRPGHSFMHPSEAEFARLLDFYNIPWEYEPRTFPLCWDNEGRVTEAFSPDFYLPEQNVYIELTTQRQKLVWKKNKKLRRLKELYPDVRIKIIYNSDYKNILASFGIQMD